MQADYLNEPQQEAVRHLAHRSGIVWWKIGKGKTRIALALFHEHLTRCQNGDGNLLIIASPAARRQWEDEMEISPYYTTLLGRVHFLSYGMLSVSSPAAPWRAYARDPAITFVVFDELWLYKNLASLRSQAARAFKLIRNRIIIGLSGTLISSKNLEDLYGQAHAVGVSQVVARTLTDFRSQFLIAYEDYGLKFAPKKGALQTIQERLAPHCHVYFPKDTREIRIQRVSVTPHPKQQYLLDTVSKDYYATVSSPTATSTIDIKSASALLVKLQQISDGAILDAEGKRIHIDSTKFERLFELLDSLSDAGERTIVWFAFKASLDYVAQKLGQKATLLSGDHTFDHIGWRKGRYTACLATVGSGASLNDFAHCKYAIVFSAPFSPRALQQSLGRTNRESSTHPVAHYYFLQTVGSPDPDIYNSLLASLQMQEGVIKLSTDIIRTYIQKWTTSNLSSIA